MVVQLTVRRVSGEEGTGSPVDGIRIMALLPPRWRKELGPIGGDIIIRVHPDEEITPAQIRAEVIKALENPEVRNWKLTACDTVPVDPGGIKEARS